MTDMKLHRLTAVLLMVLLVISIGCKKKDKLTLTPGDAGSAKEIYDKAKSRMKKDPERSRLLFKEVMHLYPDSPYAQRSKIGIADSYVKQKDAASLIMAANEYQEYVNLYPNSPDAVYAKYQIGMCYFKQMRKPGRDQENTHKAITAMQLMVKMFPDTEEAKDTREKIARARQNLAAHYFAIGLSNYRLKAFRGAVARFKQVLDDYPDYKKNDKLFYYAGKAYFATRNYDSAISFFQRVISDFPKSKFLKKSQKMIKKLNLIKKTKQEGAKK
ncbi:MAG: outer membrane protein assembly factor BamD [bacterium]|nr:outer membrane protein assembly factor BamD [bacterium]